MTPPSGSTAAAAAAFNGRISHGDHEPEPSVFVRRSARPSPTETRSRPSPATVTFSIPRFPVIGGGSWFKGTGGIIPITEGYLFAPVRQSSDFAARFES